MIHIQTWANIDKHKVMHSDIHTHTHTHTYTYTHTHTNTHSFILDTTPHYCLVNVKKIIVSDILDRILIRIQLVGWLN